MIQEVKMYTVICDNCGKDSNGGSDYSCLGAIEDAEEVAMESGWYKNGDKHYCTDCYVIDDDDKLVIGKPIQPKEERRA